MAVLKAGGLFQDSAAATTIRQVRPVAISKLQRVYEVVLSNGKAVELVMPSDASMLRLLRSERTVLNAEPLVVQWLNTVLSGKRTGVYLGSTQERQRIMEGGEQRKRAEDKVEEDGEAEADEDKAAEGSEGSSTNLGEGPTSRSSGTGNHRDLVRSSPFEDEPGLLHLLPKLIHHSSTLGDLGAPYAICLPRKGTPVVDLPTPLTHRRRARVNFDLGSLTRSLSTITSPTGLFGSAASVLGPSSTGPSTPSERNKAMSRSSTPGHPAEGSGTWSEAFHVMLEAILRDGEDMAITLPYPIIRKYAMHFSYLLDEVTEPRFVVVDGADDSNVLVDLEEDDEEDEDDEEEEDADEDDEEEEDTDEDDLEAEVQDSEGESSQSGEDTHIKDKAETRIAQSPSPKPKITRARPATVVGFRNWSNAVFGDPQIATAFTNNPSQAFLDGYYHDDSVTARSSPTPYKTTPHEVMSSADIRLLLYQAYHAIVAVVTEFYRRRGDSTTREFAARRRLNDVLTKLRQLQEGPRVSGHRRPSGEMSPAKKFKSDETDEASSSTSSRIRGTASPLREVDS